MEILTAQRIYLLKVWDSGCREWQWKTYLNLPLLGGRWTRKFFQEQGKPELSLEIPVAITRMSSCILIDLAVAQKCAFLEMPIRFTKDWLSGFLRSSCSLCIFYANAMSTLFLWTLFRCWEDFHVSDPWQEENSFQIESTLKTEPHPMKFESLSIFQSLGCKCLQMCYLRSPDC